MLRRPQRDRRHFLSRLLASGALGLAGCDRLSQDPGVQKILGAAEPLTRAAQNALTPRRAMAQEFSPADLSPNFPGNGTTAPREEDYLALAANGFRDWRLEVGGLVETPASLSLAELRALPARIQITRHDCVEGWSAIGQWTGVPLATVLERARVRPAARYAVFYCMDALDAWGPKYYESIDLDDAFHPQTLLAYALNGRPLPVANGAPLRLRVERQLGYKMAKYLARIELVEDFKGIQGGHGGYWEDQGYEWYAGI